MYPIYPDLSFLQNEVNTTDYTARSLKTIQRAKQTLLFTRVRHL